MASHDHTTRWTPQRKATVIERLLQGLTTSEEISADHGVGAEELEAWTENYRAHGLGALKASRSPPIRTTETRVRFRGGAAAAAISVR